MRADLRQRQVLRSHGHGQLGRQAETYPARFAVHHHRVNSGRGDRPCREPRPRHRARCCDAVLPRGRRGVIGGPSVRDHDEQLPAARVPDRLNPQGLA